MEIKTLLSGIELLEKPPLPSLEINSIAYDSRKVVPGSLFIAIQGSQSDGHDYMSQAISKGAIAIVCEKIPQKILEKSALFLKVQNSRQALSKISKNFFGSPTHNIKVVGITGTNGKTTTSYLIEAILNEADLAPTVIGTINFRYENKIFPSTHTTPESVDLDAFIQDRSNEGSQSLVMEVSSHAIDQHRVDDLDFNVCIFSNLTPDHLDYHHSMEKYFEVKSKLFLEILPKSSKKKKCAVLNVDDPWVSRLADKMKLPVLRVSLHSSKAELHVLNKKMTVHGIEADIQTPQGKLQIISPLLGEFNLFNLMAAAAAGIALEIPLAIIEKALKNFKSVPGRLERVENEKNIHVFVDYAHTPDALKNVLQTLKQIVEATCTLAPLNGVGRSSVLPRIITIFGCGGDRDKTKRPLMGAEVAKYSDRAILTSDNPRTEDPIQILGDVIPGLESQGWKEKEHFLVEVDRKKGIGLALSQAKAGDIVLIAGKGHEDYQIIGKEKFHFDDREIAKGYLD